MTKIKRYVKLSLLLGGSLIFYLVLLSLLNYSGAVNFNVIIKINFIFTALIVFIFGIHNGKNAIKKGYLEGIKWGFLIISIIFLVNLIFYRAFNLTIFLYYLIILISSTFGSVIGINLKKK